MYYESIIVKKLTLDDIYTLKEELLSNASLWSPHVPDLNLTSLKDGNSIHLQWCDDELNIVTDNWKYFPKTQKLLKNIVSDNNLGRVYWHRLLSGDKINAHTDANIPFVKSGDLQHRYQIYLDIDTNVVIFFNKHLIDVDRITNTVIDFPLKSLHYYINNSKSALYLLVFDDIGTPSRI